MAEVSSLTAARMLQIEQQSVVGGRIENDELILTTYGGAEINSGVVKGDKGNSGETPAVMKIDSSNGLIFKNNVVGSVLTATVFFGAQAIQDQLHLIDRYGPTARLQWSWKKFGDSDFAIIPPEDPRISNDGFRFDVETADVDIKTTFKCVLLRG